MLSYTYMYKFSKCFTEKNLITMWFIEAMIDNLTFYFSFVIKSFAYISVAGTTIQSEAWLAVKCMLRDSNVDNNLPTVYFG
jgi:hypothetical protein